MPGMFPRSAARAATACIALLLTSAGCLGSPEELASKQSGDPDDDVELGLVSQAISVPANMGRWCSVKDTAGGWGFDWGSATSDPCADMLASSPGMTIQAAGLYSTNAANKVLLLCNGQVGLWFGQTGGAALQGAYDRADSANFVGCKFIVAPYALPIFDAPFKNDSASIAANHVRMWKGFDQAFTPLDVSVFGQTPAGAGDASQVDHLGRDRRNETSNGHHGHDWGMDSGTKILAVADGTVISSRARDVSTFGCGTDAQQEVYILHKVGSGTYREWFVSYYAHFKSRNVATGDTVTRGQQLGLAGDTGCASGVHLHFGVTRMTNTVGWYHRTFAVTVGDNTSPGSAGHNSSAGMIDPFGWAAPKHIDPWGWRFRGSVDDFGNALGAWSINLWRSASVTPPNTW